MLEFVSGVEHPTQQELGHFQCGQSFALMLTSSQDFRCGVHSTFASKSAELLLVIILNVQATLIN